MVWVKAFLLHNKGPVVNEMGNVLNLSATCELFWFKVQAFSQYYIVHNHKIDITSTVYEMFVF